MYELILIVKLQTKKQAEQVKEKHTYNVQVQYYLILFRINSNISTIIVKTRINTNVMNLLVY